jgi:hypothetical protein
VRFRRLYAEEQLCVFALREPLFNGRKRVHGSPATVRAQRETSHISPDDLMKTIRNRAPH